MKKARLPESIGKEYKPWVILSVAVLVLSLLLLAIAVTAAFLFFNDGGSPLWVVVLGGFAVFGIVLGFAGFAGIMGVAGWRSMREARRVQVLPPKP